MKDKFRPLMTVVMTGVVIITFGILFFFLIFRAGAVMSAFRQLCNILMPFIYGLVIAYLIRPICNMFEKLLMKGVRKYSFHVKGNIVTLISILLSYLAAFIVLYFLLSSVLPQLTRSLIRLTYAIPTYIQQLEAGAESLFEGNTFIQNTLNTSTESIIDTFEDWTQTNVLPYLRSMMSNFSYGLIGAVGVLGDLFIGLIAAVYMLANRHKFLAQGRMVLYSAVNVQVAQWFESEIIYADKMFTGFLGGKIVDSTIVGIICFIGCTILKVPNAMLCSVVVGVTNIIPFFGPYIGMVPAGLIILLTSPVKALTFVIFDLLLQQIDGNIIGPRILGNSTGLSGFWVLFAILMFGGLWGFPGMIVGVPVFAVIYDIIKRGVHYGLTKRGRGDMILEYENKYPEEAELEKKQREFHIILPKNEKKEQA